MKTTFILTFVLLAAAYMPAAAQDKSSGKISYTLTMNLHANLKPEQMQYKDMIPETATQDASLWFNKQRFKTFYNANQKKEGDDVEVNVNIQSDNGDELYVDLDSKKQWAKKNGKLKEAPLDIRKGESIATGATKEILGYPCQQLILVNKKDSTTIWYTTALPLHAGSPIGMFTDKGVVLEMQHRKMSFMATAIEFMPIRDEELAISR
ncbi:GLPGLI family protein [Chitinophaga sp. W3I9]|uniref:GLPGLI family protein n=1 Tax=Chitinophaga sp. W3I9 TaxID=3373924 RepID=UPI003D1CA2B2